MYASEYNFPPTTIVGHEALTPSKKPELPSGCIKTVGPHGLFQQTIGGQKKLRVKILQRYSFHNLTLNNVNAVPSVQY